jgi:hypothetical protein
LFLLAQLNWKKLGFAKNESFNMKIVFIGSIKLGKSRDLPDWKVLLWKTLSLYVVKYNPRESWHPPGVIERYVSKGSFLCIRKHTWLIVQYVHMYCSALALS